MTLCKLIEVAKLSETTGVQILALLPTYCLRDCSKSHDLPCLSFLICKIEILISAHRIVIRIRVTVSFLNFLNVPTEEEIIES